MQMLARVLVQVFVVVALMLCAGTAVVVGRTRLAETRREYRDRLRSVAPVALVLVGVLLANNVARQIVPDLSWMIQWKLTSTIYALEGEFIAWIQSFATPYVTAYFSFVYIFGYVFLLIFPVIAYFALSDTRPLRELMLAYSINYALGLACYVLFIAYGPRNIRPEMVEALLYDTYPQYQHLTRQVNRNTNVFPSLHASLSATVALLAYRTRDQYPAWAPIAVAFALSVCISTMYLGIHWATDVVAGIGLAVVSVGLAAALVDRIDLV